MAQDSERGIGEMSALVVRVTTSIIPLACLVLSLSCSKASDGGPMRRYAIGEAAVWIPEDTGVEVEPIADFTIHTLSNRRLKVELGVYDGFAPDFEKQSSPERVVTREVIGGFPAWRVVHHPPGRCSAELLVEVPTVAFGGQETASFLHFFYHSTEPAGCEVADKIVRSLHIR